MRKIILLSILIPFFCACAQQQSGTTVIINAKNYDAETIILSWFTPEGEFTREVITLAEGRAEVTIDVPEATTLRLANLDSRGCIPTGGGGIIPGPLFAFYATKGTITLSFDAEKWPELTIKGGKLNADMNRYWKEMGPLMAKDFEATRRRFGGERTAESEVENIQLEQANIAEKFIDNNPNSLVAIDLLLQYYLRFETDVLEAKFNKFTTKIKESPTGIAIADRLAKDKSLVAGNPAPPFTKKDKDGNDVSLSDYKGQYLLIDFWGTWCGPCRQSHPHLIEMYHKYSHLGLAFLNVAQEGGRDPRPGWLKAIENDGLIWTQILNDEGKEECDVVALFNISAFPTKILIDPQGNIVAKWLGDVPEVDEKLVELFGV